jgi:hypothetical protein
MSTIKHTPSHLLKELAKRKIRQLFFSKKNYTTDTFLLTVYLIRYHTENFKIYLYFYKT